MTVWNSGGGDFVLWVLTLHKPFVDFEDSAMGEFCTNFSVTKQIIRKTCQTEKELEN